MALPRIEADIIRQQQGIIRELWSELQQTKGALSLLQYQASARQQIANNPAGIPGTTHVNALNGLNARVPHQQGATRFDHLGRRNGFDPNQPRVRAGNPDGGQWTRLAGAAGALPVDEISSARRTIGPPPPPPRIVRPRGMTPGEQERFDRAAQRYVAAKRRIPNEEWEPKEPEVTVPGSIEGAIARMEAWASQAEAEAYRLGPRGNNPPPLNVPIPSRPRPPLPPRPTHPKEFQDWMEDFRSLHNQPDLFGNPIWPHDKGTVSISLFKGKIFFGVSSDVSARYLYTNADRITATVARDALVRKYPDIMNTRNVGQIPNDALFHAEATILFRMARANGGTLAGQVIEVHTDRPMCPHSCPPVLPKLGLELGNPMVTFVGPNGERRTMWNDGWLP
jgi:hypothetical protein